MIEFKPATREGVKPLIAIAGESNSGKTMSALLLARGIAGPTGKVILVDTESGRGSLYANEIPGGYLRGDFVPPFTPQAYIDALNSSEDSGAVVAVFDSFSHEWEGEGGVCDMAGDNEAKSGRAGLHNWKTPKMEHKQLILRLQRSKCVVIVCLRAMHKTRQVKTNGKTEIIKDDFLTPIQSEGFVFDATIILDMQRSNPGHFVLSKWSVPDLKRCFPDCGPNVVSPVQLSDAHGEAIAAWCKGLEAPAPKLGLAYWKKKIWDTAKPKFGDIKAFQQWLWDEALIDPGESLGQLNESQLESLTAKVQTKLDNQ